MISLIRPNFLSILEPGSFMAGYMKTIRFLSVCTSGNPHSGVFRNVTSDLFNETEEQD